MITHDDIEAFNTVRPLPTHVIQKLWLSGFVRRWHSNDDWRLRESGEINGGHAQRVAILYAGLFDPTVEGLLLSILHDAPEVLSGDVSAPAKARIPELGTGDKQAAVQYWKALGLDNWSLKTDEVSLCDLLDAIMFARYRAPDLMDRHDWGADKMRCLAMAQKLGVYRTVDCLIRWEWKHGEF